MAEHPKSADLVAISEALADAGIDCIVIGGVAAITHGATTMTRDFDVVHRRTPENTARIHAFLQAHGGYFRNDFSGRRLVPNDSHLLGKGQILTITDLGPIDFLGTIHDGRGYDELVTSTEVLALEGRTLRVLDLPTLIEVKTAAGRTKDLLAVVELKAILERRLASAR